MAGEPPRQRLYSAEMETNLIARIDTKLNELMPSAHDFPSLIHRAMRHGVLCGGKRLRSRLTLLIADAAAQTPLTRAEGELAMLAACAIELIHAASLIHDDLPAFDNAKTRRGKPTVHIMFGETAAILAGDALLTLAFDVLSRAGPNVLDRGMSIINVLARCVGSREGIIGGQSLELHWETSLSSDEIPAAAGESEQRRQVRALGRYHEMKTGALFRGAAEAGALAAGMSNPSRWRMLGHTVGWFLQLVDDLYDVAPSPRHPLKPVGQDAALGRPNAALLRGISQVKQETEVVLADLRQQISELATNPQPLLGFTTELSAYLDQALG
jgi:geranylgeranyl diphosphate synthase, type II